MRLLENFLELARRGARPAREDGVMRARGRASRFGLPDGDSRPRGRTGRTTSIARSRAAHVDVARIMEGAATPAQIGALLMGLRMKGETLEELAGAAEAMRRVRHAGALTARRPLLDTCGTGGDGRGTPNISTAAGLWPPPAACRSPSTATARSAAAPARPTSSRRPGVRIDLSPEQMGRCLEEVGFALLFAPALHGAMKHAVGPRREMRLRTIFNLLGPLTNPAGRRAPAPRRLRRRRGRS